MPVRFGGEVKYLWLAITNLLRAKACFQGKILPASAMPSRWRTAKLPELRSDFLQHLPQDRHVPFALPDLRRDDVFRRNSRKSAPRRKLRRRSHGDQSA